MINELTVVTGAGGFIGGSLVADFRKRGFRKIRAVDSKPLEEWYQRFDDVQNLSLDLNLKENCEIAARDAFQIYNFAANMGGMGFIEHNKALCMLSVLINTQMLQAAQQYGAQKFFYSSSACVYNGDKQRDTDCPGLKEEDAYPALAEDGYGWEKLFSERMCRHFREDYGLHTRVARFHNVYGPHGTWYGGREKAPAAICRKVIEAKASGSHEIEIWGSGNQTRSFMYIDDCLKGVRDDHELRDPRPHQPRLGGNGFHQSTGGHGGRNRGRQAKTELQLVGAQRRQRPQQRQHADPQASQLGTLHLIARGPGKNLRLDLRAVSGP